MPRNTATTYATGGGGFTFADKVAAAFFAQMLQGSFPFEPEVGSIRELHFEARDAGQVLDDFLLALDHHGTRRRCAISVKSNSQLTTTGFSAQFAQDAWDQWQQAPTAHFDASTDLLGLIVGIADSASLQEWRELQKQATNTTPERLVLRLGNKGQCSKIQRDIFASLRIELKGAKPSEVETAKLIASLRVLHFSDVKEGELIQLCTDLVRDGRPDGGLDLWNRLVKYAADQRPLGSQVHIEKLLRQLRGGSELKDYPDFEADWTKLESISAHNLRSVRAVLGNGIRLTRNEELNTLSSAIASAPMTLVVGESGSGKTALLARIVGSGDRFKRVLWLSASQCSKASQTELAQTLGLQNSIPALTARSTVQDCALVIDGFEQFQVEARSRMLELAKALREIEFVGWRAVFTCQPTARDAAREFAVEAGISLESVEERELEKPALAEVIDAVRHVTGISVLLLREDLQTILRNLVVLDWVLKADVAGRFTTSPYAWIGETELIDCIWERWTGTSTQRLARDSLLRKLGQSEGSRISGAVHLDAVTADQLPLLGALADEGLVVIDGPSVRFSHDLIGDWARYRSLVFWSTDSANKILECSAIPRWARAIRLYAQGLAERGTGLNAWRSVAAQIAGETIEARLAADLFLDGLLFAANSAVLLEWVWPDLVKDRAELLARLLKRLLHVASRPDPRLRLFVGLQVTEQSEAWLRLPEPHYWYPALLVLSRHASDVATHVLLQAAEVCALWLRTMPEGMPGRREASILALELARETQAKLAEGLNFGEHDRPVYEALLYAAPECAEEVASIALELGARRDEPAPAVERRMAFRKEEARRQAEWIETHSEEAARRRQLPRPISFPEGPIRPPFKDGPKRRVSEGFRSAVLDTPALDGLVRCRPMIAKEVLLASCLDEPKPWNPYRERHLLSDSLGLAHWQRGYPPAYWKGPFLKFLQTAPQEGLEAIVALVNHATERWLEVAAGPKFTPETRKRYGLEFTVEASTIGWIGNSHLYGWHRQVPLGGTMVGCALMALERWLYDELAQSRSITSPLRYVMTHGESMAFGGVLVAVGLKHPGLFTGDLQPLLGNMTLYWYQENWSGAEQRGDLSFELTEVQPFLKLAQDWHAMPHRRYVLWDVATSLMLQDHGTMAYLTERRSEWSKRLEGAGEDRERLEFFLARFDPANYTHTPLPDGMVRISMRWPEHLEAVVQKSSDERALKTLALTMQSQARQCLSGKAHVLPEQLATWFNKIERLVVWEPAETDQSLDQYRVNSVAGGLAVLVVQHGEWLSQRPDTKQWCMERLREVKPPTGSEFDSTHSMLDHTAESFLGEAGVALLAESREEWILALAFEGVTGFYYLSTLQVMWRAYVLRERLGSAFDELVNLAIGWSALRRGAERESGYQTDRDLLAKYKRTLFRRYVAGDLKGPLTSLERAELLGKRIVERIAYRSSSPTDRQSSEAHERWIRERSQSEHKLYREHPKLDTEVLRKGFGFLFAMIRNPLPTDEVRVRDYVRALFDLEMRSLPRSERAEFEEIEGTPYQFDVWMMERVAEYLSQTSSADEAREYYEPILRLGPSGRYWVEDFLQSWIIVGLEVTKDKIAFVKLWQAMVAFTESLPVWSAGEGNYWARAEPLAIDLMGLHKEAAAILGQARHKDVVTAMAPTFERWGARWLKFGTVAAWFAAFLATESGQVLLTTAIKQLADAIGSFQDRDWHREGLGGLLTEVLGTCWRVRRQDLRSDSKLRNAFLTMLGHLCARQVPEALHLRSKVAESFDEAQV